MSLAFLSPDPELPAHSPLVSTLAAAGAQFEVRDGWEVAVRLADAESEARSRDERVAWADFSHLHKLELQGEAESLNAVRLRVQRARSGTWLPLTPERALLLDGEQPDPSGGLRLLDVTSQLGAVRIAGPLARELFARFCALDLRPHLCPPGTSLPGSVARTPGHVVCEQADRFLLLFGAAYATYVWEVLSDAGEQLGGRAVGVDALSGAQAPSHA